MVRNWDVSPKLSHNVLEKYTSRKVTQSLSYSEHFPLVARKLKAVGTFIKHVSGADTGFQKGGGPGNC